MSFNKFKILSFSKYGLIIFSILLILFLYTPSIFFFFRDSNQGAQLSKAQEILNGFHPFVDIMGNIYGPLVFYFSTLGQLLSGNRLIGEIFIIVIGYLSSYLLLYYLMERFTKSFMISYLLLITLLLFLPRFYKYYIVLAPILVLFSIYYLIFRNRNYNGVVFLGISCGISILFRFDFGVYAFIVGLSVIYLSLKDKGKKILRNNFIYFTASVFFVGLPFLLLLILNNRFPGAIIETFEVVVGMAHGMDLPVPVFNFHQSLFSLYNNISLFFWFFRILPFIVLIILLTLKKKIEQKERLFIFVTSVFSILLYIQALNRPHIFHTLQAIPMQFILIAWIFGYSNKKIVRKSFSIKLAIVSTTLILLFLIIPFVKNHHLIKKHGEYNSNLKNWFSNYKELFLTKESLREKYKKKNGLIRITDFVNRRTKKDESVLFIPVAPQLYYFSERVFKTSLGVLGPGRLTTREKQSAFFRELIDTNTNIIVDFYEFSYDKIAERNPRYYYPYLMNLIYSNYKIVSKFGNRTLLCRDNRFNKFLTNKLPSFSNMTYEKNIFIKKKIPANIYRINTLFAKNITKVSIVKKGVLFCEIKISLEKSIIKKYFLGLIKGSKLYFTDIKPLKRKKAKNNFKFEVFSSTSNVPEGSYKMIVFYSEDQNKWYYEELPIEILITKPIN